MSVAASHSPADLPPEPFGQAGIRQYAGRILAWLFLTVGLCAAAMGHRSGRFEDVVEWSGRGQWLSIRSTGGRLTVLAAGKQGETGEGHGWSFGGRYNRRPDGWARRPWRTTLGDVAGIEAVVGPPDSNFDSGFYFRASWPSLAVLFLVWPLVYGVRAIVRRVRPPADE
jgi:hypothetical protein